MMRIVWTAEMDAELKRIYALPYYGQKSAAVGRLAKRMGITAKKCSERAVALGIAHQRRAWTKVEFENLMHYAGSKSCRSIARILGRSERSIRGQSFKLGLSTAVDGYTVNHLAQLLGVKPETLAPLIRREQKGAKFSACDVQLWFFEHIDSFDLRRCDQVWLKRMLKDVAA